MKRIAFGLFSVLAIVVNSGRAQLAPPPIEWQRCYGTTVFHERLTTMVQTSDEGFLFGGVSTDLNDGYLDWYVVRVDGTGQQLWARTFGGSDEDELESLAQTQDGGFILGGRSISPADGNKTSPFLGGLGDCWVVRLDADGNKLWDYSYGGSDRDELRAIRQTADGGFVFGGTSSSTNGTKHSPSWGGSADFWIVRLDAAGSVLWEQSYGGGGEDYLNDLQQTSDGGFIAVGYSDSPTNTIKSAPSFGDWDYWIVRVDATGQKLWDRTYGGTLRDFAIGVQVTPDGGYVVVGGSGSGAGGNKLSSNYASPANYGSSDYWMLRLDADGNRLWESEFGGTSDDVPTSLQRTADGGFLIGGYTLSDEDGNKASVNHGYFDYWVVRTDAVGHRLWDQSYGGTEVDRLGAVLQARDGGFLIGGYSSSGVNGNKTATNLFGEDFWVIKLGPDALTAPPHLRWERCCFEAVGPQYRLLLSGSSNLTYHTEVSTNLADWTALATNRVLGADAEVFYSALGSPPQRFFRAHLAP